MNKPGRFSNQINNFRKNYYEKTAWQDDLTVCGVDEVGRGCLAGPVVTAAVVLPVGKAHRFLKDSKTMTPEERKLAYDWITQHCDYAYGIINHRQIDAINIYQATLLAMKKALFQLLTTCHKQPSAILVDAMPVKLSGSPFETIPVHYFPFGESKSSSIAAASIIAKVKRDELMTELNTLVPGYNFAGHKGYSTPEHKKLVGVMGESIIHRATYVKTINQKAEHAEYKKQLQQALF